MKKLFFVIVVIFCFLGISGCGSGNDDEVLYPMPDKNGVVGYVDRSGEWVIEPQFATANNFHEGLAVAREYSDALPNLYGYIDKSGEWVIEPQYLEAGDFSNGLAAVSKEDWEIKIRYGDDTSEGNPSYLTGYIDKNGEIAISPKYEQGHEFVDGKAFVSEYEDIKLGDTVTYTGIPTDYITDSEGNQYVTGTELTCDILYTKFIDTSGNEVETDYPPNVTELYDDRGLYYNGENGKYGYLNEKGIEVIEAVFDEARNFSSGVALVQDPVTKLFGYIDTSGNWVIPPEYKYGNDFYNGLALVEKKNEGYGYINKNNEWVIESKAKH